MRYVIVGNGVAGTRAAETIRRRDPQGEIVVVSDERSPFYRRPALVEHLLGRVPLEGLWGRRPESYQQAGIDLRLEAPAVGIDPQGHRLALAGGTSLEYDRLLLAVGLGLRLSLFPGAALAGVVSLQRLADVPVLRSAVARARRAVVVGEGVLGLELARAFRGLDLAVTYLVGGSRFWAEVLSPDASMLVEQRLRSEGVDVQPGQQVKAFQGDDGHVRAVLTEAGDALPADVVGLASGLGPPLAWARDAGLRMEHRVWVDEYLATNLPDVYAAGDAVALQDEVLPFGWQRAWHQGAVAGMNMTGGHEPYRRRTVSLSTRAFGLPVLVMGEPNPRGRKVRRQHGDYPQGGVHKELVTDDEGRVVGALMVGDINEASKVEEVVRRRLPYDQVEPDLTRRIFDMRYWVDAGTEVLCPVCKFLVQVGEEERLLGRSSCPICGVEFALRSEAGRLAVEL